MNACLCAGEGLSGNTQFVNRHRQEGHRNTLARGEENIHFTFGSMLGNLSGRVQEVVSCIAHCGDDNDELVSGVSSVDDAFCNAFDRFDIGDGRASVLLHDERHE